MRLIDLDKLLKEFPIRVNHYDKENGDLRYVLGIEAVMDYVKEMPTVEAIPVEWLKNRGEEFEKEYYNLFHIYTDESINNQVQVLDDFHAFNTVLRYWGKENEQNKENTSQTD